MFVRSELKQRNYKGWYIKLLRASEGLEATTSEATEEATGEKLEALGGTTTVLVLQPEKKRRSFSTFGGTSEAFPLSEVIEEITTIKKH